MYSPGASVRLKRKIKALLDTQDLDQIEALHRQDGRVLRFLISMTYDRDDPASWRAIMCIGRLTAGMSADRVRNLIQRLLWMMREESGTNSWSAGCIIGEIIRANPGPFEDIVPVVISFHDEKLLRAGSLRAMARIAQVRPELVEPFEDVATGYLSSEDPHDRGFALLAVKALGRRAHLPKVERLLADGAAFVYFDGSRMVEVSIGELASEVAESLGRAAGRCGRPG